MIKDRDQAISYAKGELAVEIALKLWPELKVTKRFSEEDRHDIDAFFLNGQSVQIRADIPMLRTNNLFWQNGYVSQASRKLVTIKERASLYIHVCWDTNHGFAIMFPSSLIEANSGNWVEHLLQSGSRGFLIELDELPPNSYQKIGFTLPL